MAEICGWSSGSPPAMLTTGASHSSEARRQSSTERSFLRMETGYWIFPHPVQERLQRKSGSSMSTSGYFSRPASRCSRTYFATAAICAAGIDMPCSAPSRTVRTCTCFRMPRGIAGFGDSARNPCSSGYGIPAPNGSCHPRGAAAIANFPQKGFIGRRSLPRFQIEDVPGERPAIRFGQIRELHHRGTRDAFSERLEDLADALSLAKFLRGEVARPRIEPARGGTVARTTLAVARDTVDGVGRLPLLDELRRPFRRLAGRRGRAREGECAEDRAREKTGTAPLREAEPGGSGARGERGGGRSAGKLRAR